LFGGIEDLLTDELRTNVLVSEGCVRVCSSIGDSLQHSSVMPGDAGVGARSATGRWGRSGAGTVAVALVLVVTVTGCGDDGRALREPGADQTTTSAPPGGTTTTLAAGATTTTTVPLQIASPAFGDGATIPAPYTCRGADVTPPLSWTGIPTDTVELAIVVRDVDAEGFVHWVVAGMAPTVGGIAEATPPPGIEATNDFGRPGWAGPCPPSGTHNYEFTLFALAEPSGVAAGQPASEAANAVESRAVRASAVLSGSASAG
jgi:Raf kinase inhibitor-like YbhB/YbcL family protein